MRGGKKEALPEEQITIEFAFSTLIAARDIPAGHTITRDDLTTKRPYLSGILASQIDEVIGKQTTIGIKAGSHLQWADIA
jgi:N-acetylneuraminate synthase